MSSKNLSSVATDVIESYGITAINVINTLRFGGQRLVGFVDNGFATAVNSGGAFLNRNLRSNLIGSQQRVSGYYAQGLNYGGERAETVVGVAVDLASKGVGIVAENAGRFQQTTNLGALDTLNRVVLPAANVISVVADRVEKGSSELVRRVSGKPVPAKAVATRTLNSATRKAAAARKRVTKTATKQVKTATKQVSKAVAKRATQTSNTARRIARKAKATAAAA